MPTGASELHNVAQHFTMSRQGFGSAVTTDFWFGVAPRNGILVSAYAIWGTAGSNNGTLTVKKQTAAAQTVADGTAMTSALSVTTTADTVMQFTLSTSEQNRTVTVGQAIGMDILTLDSLAQCDVTLVFECV